MTTSAPLHLAATASDGHFGDMRQSTDDSWLGTQWNRYTENGESRWLTERIPMCSDIGSEWQAFGNKQFGFDALKIQQKRK